MIFCNHNEVGQIHTKEGLKTAYNYNYHNVRGNIDRSKY